MTDTPDTAVPPRVLERSDIVEAARYVVANVKAPAVGALLASAGCLDADPHAGKRRRVRAAIDATQARDGHAGAIVRLIELVAAAHEAETRRQTALREARTASAGSTLTRAQISTGEGFRLDVGVTRGPDGPHNPSVALTIFPDLEGAPIVLDLDVAGELITELIAARREAAERRARAVNPHQRFAESD